MLPTNSTKVRVLYVARGVPPIVGGMERYSGDLIASGSADSSQAFTWSGSRVHLLWWIPWTWFRTVWCLASGAYDVLHVTDALLAPFFLSAARLTGVPIVVTTHALDVVWSPAVYQWCMRMFLPRCDRLVAVSQATARECEARGVKPEQITIIPNGIHPASMTDRAVARSHLLETYGLPPNSFILLSVGRLIERKNLAWFIECVLPRLPERAILLVLGDGPEFEKLSRISRASAHTNQIRFAGRVSSAERDLAYDGSDLFLMPNRSVPGDAEGFGIVNIEAASHGLPVVASRLEGITEAVIDGENGRTLPPEDTEAFVETIQHFMDHEVERQRLAERARQFTIARFDWTELAKQYHNLYQQLCSGMRRRGA